MEKTVGFGNGLSPEIQIVAEKLVEMLHPSVIYLYNQRVSAVGHTTGFKLCVVASLQDKRKAEHCAYMEIDCDVPFDLLLYTPEEWADITARKDSFAAKIQRTGKIVYG